MEKGKVDIFHEQSSIFDSWGWRVGRALSSSAQRQAVYHGTSARPDTQSSKCRDVTIQVRDAQT